MTKTPGCVLPTELYLLREKERETSASLKSSVLAMSVATTAKQYQVQQNITWPMGVIDEEDDDNDMTRYGVKMTNMAPVTAAELVTHIMKKLCRLMWYIVALVAVGMPSCIDLEGAPMYRPQVCLHI